MTDFASELLSSAIVTARAAPTVIAAFAGRPVQVWDQAPGRGPQGPADEDFPMIADFDVQVVGDEVVEGEDMSPDGDDDVIEDDPLEGFLTLHVYSRIRADGQGGKPEAMQIGGALRRVLGRALDVAGHRVTLGHMQTSRYFTESDGLTAHGVLSFRYLAQPTEA